jgi:hypothetical protein
MSYDLQTIREAICRNHGGFIDSTDDQILRLWNALGKEVQEHYIKQEEKKDAVSAGTRTDSQSGTGVGSRKKGPTDVSLPVSDGPTAADPAGIV